MNKKYPTCYARILLAYHKVRLCFVESEVRATATCVHREKLDHLLRTISYYSRNGSKLFQIYSQISIQTYFTIMNRETSHTFKNLTSKLTSKTYSCSNKSIEERNIRRDLKKFEEKETPRTLELNEGISRCEQPTAIWQKVRLPIGRNVKNGYKGGTKREREREEKNLLVG